MPSVLFVCVANSCRSQMAEAFANASAGKEWEVWSAGSHPSGRVHPVATQLMGELKMDLSAHRSKGLDEVPQRQWDYVVTMGCGVLRSDSGRRPERSRTDGDACPAVNARQRIDWSISDPVGLPIDEARGIRDQIAGLVSGLLHL